MCAVEVVLHTTRRSRVCASHALIVRATIGASSHGLCQSAVPRDDCANHNCCVHLRLRVFACVCVFVWQVCWHCTLSRVLSCLSVVCCCRVRCCASDLRSNPIESNRAHRDHTTERTTNNSRNHSLHQQVIRKRHHTTTNRTNDRHHSKVAQRRQLQQQRQQTTNGERRTANGERRRTTTVVAGCVGVCG